MLQKPNTVFVGKKVNSTGTTLAVGDVVVLNAATGAPIAVSAIATTPEIQLGIVKAVGATDAKADMAKTQKIALDKVVSSVFTAYKAKTEATAEIDLSAATIVEGNRYVIRVIYKDIYEHPGQFTHSYEAIAEAGETATTLAGKIVARVTAHKGARVTAVNAAGVITLTAKEIPALSNNVDAAGTYKQVSMSVAAYYTNPSDVWFSAYRAIPGAEITVTNGSPGKGNPHIVRQRENEALGYKGITFRTAWPHIGPALRTDMSKTYDEFVIEFFVNYQSPDNSYVKRTELASELYVEAGAGLAALNTAILAAINPAPTAP